LRERNAEFYSKQHRQQISRRAQRVDAVGFFNLLTGPELLEVTESHLPEHRERLYPPTAAHHHCNCRSRHRLPEDVAVRANANSTRVTLDVERERVRLEICDDGEGVKDIGPYAPGLGLRTMQYRALMIGARFEIAPFGRKGTRVLCDCPQDSARA
jgi:hypothetical protein